MDLTPEATPEGPDQILTYRWYSWQAWGQPLDRIAPTIEIRVRPRPGDDVNTQFRMEHELNHAVREIRRRLSTYYAEHTPTPEGWSHDPAPRDEQARHASE